MTDQQLLEEFVQEGNQSAFTELVHRHVGWVCSMATRLTRGNRAMAEDATQAVFILLAQKAGSLLSHRSLSNWLFIVTRYSVSNALRNERVRRRHEQEAAAMRNEASESPARWDDVSPQLDELVGKLRWTDRQAVLLRFYQSKTFPEIGAALSMTEEAARKRVSRAVEQLRSGLARRGVVVGAAAFAAGLSANLTQPASAAVIAGAAAAPAAAATPAVQGLSSMVTWMTVKPIVVAVVSIIVTGAMATALLQLRAPTPRAAAPATAPAQIPEERLYRGRVLAADSSPVSDAKVFLVDSNRLAPSIIATVASHPPQGGFVLPRKPDSTGVIAYSPGKGLAGLNIAVNQGNVPIDITFRKRSDVHAHFLDPDGKPASGVRVSVSQVADSRWRWQFQVPEELQNLMAQTTDAQGECTFEGMPENSIVTLDVLDPRYVRLQALPQNRSTMQSSSTVWVGPAGVARSGDVQLELAGTITGSLTYADTGKPAGGVLIRFRWKPGSTPGAPRPGPDNVFADTWAITLDDGRYRRSQLRPGEYTISLDSGGEVGSHYNAPAIEHIIVSDAKETASQDFKLTAGGIVRGKVVLNGQGVGGVPIMITGPASLAEIASLRAGRTGQPTRTDGDGNYEFHVPPGEQTVLLGFPLPNGLVSLMEDTPTVSVEDGKAVVLADLPLTTEAPPPLTGQVTDADGKPVAGAYVSIQGGLPGFNPARGFNSGRALAASRAAIAVSDADGRFSLANVGAGVKVRAQKGELVSASVSAPTDGTPVTLHLGDPSLASVLVQVRDSQGLAIYDARVMISTTSGGGIVQGRGNPQRQQVLLALNSGEGRVTGANGDCVLDGMDPGLGYDLRISAAGFGDKSIMSANNDLKLVSGQRATISVVLPHKDSFVGGIVLDENFKPKTAVDVYVGPGIYGNLHSNKKVTTDANGRFRAEGFLEDTADTATIEHADGSQRRQTVRTGRDDNLVVDRPTPTEARGIKIDYGHASPRGQDALPEELDAAKALVAAGGVVTTEGQRGDTPIITVQFSKAGLTDEQLKPIAQLKSVESLTISSPNLTDEGMSALSELHALTQLVLLSSKIGDAGIKPLKDLKYLQTVGLGSAPITDAGLADLAQLPVLTSLTLSSTKITDAGLKHLSQMKYLATLNLRNTKIGDEGLKELRGMHSLRSLDLRGTQVTENGIAELGKALPTLRILH